MREIIFRGKRKDTGEWVEGYYSGYGLICQNEPEDTYNATGDYCGQTPYVGFVEVDPATVGQYIGQTDKNGKKIFEGDILRITDRYGKFLDWRVEFRKGAFSIKHPDCNYWCGIGDFDGYIIEIIGNIHDNPELMEEGNHEAH